MLKFFRTPDGGLDQLTPSHFLVRIPAAAGNYELGAYDSHMKGDLVHMTVI